MKGTFDHFEQGKELRRQAEERFSKQPMSRPDLLAISSPGETLKTLHELQVSQIELELQNEELRRTRAELDASHAQYIDLYNLAPVAYLTLSEKGAILEANVTAASFLDTVRSSLIGLSLARFIHPEDQALYNYCITRLFAAGGVQTCTVRIVVRDQDMAWVVLTMNVAHTTAGVPVCKLVMSDIAELKRAEEALKLVHEQLENKVLERTAELQAEVEAHRKSLRALQESEEKFRTVADWTYDWEYWVDPQGGLRYVSPSVQRITGYSPAAFSADPAFMRSIIYPEDLLLWEEHIRACCECPAEDGHLVFRIITARGEVRSIEHLCQTVYDSDGRHLGRRASNRDITDLKRLEAELKQKEEKFHAFFDTAKDGIFIMNATGDIIDLNASFGTMHGYTVEEMRSMNLRDLDTPETSRQAPERMKRLLNGEPLTFEVEHVHKDGRVISLEASVNRVSIGGVYYLIATHRDISERKKMQEALNESLELSSLFIRHSPIYAYIKEVTPTSSVILHASDNFRQMLGMSGSEMAGRSMEKLFPADFAKKITEDDWSVVSQGVGLRKDEEFHGRSFITFKYPIFQRDKTLLAGYSIDNTELRESEKALKDALHSAEAANKAKSDFLASMSHEIRTPMSGVLGMAGLLLETPLAGRQRHFAEKIKTSGELLLTVLNDILDMAKVEAGKLHLEEIPFSLEQLIETAVSVFSYQAEEKGIDLRSSLDEELPPVLLGDPTRLAQVLNNLLSNAVKFTAAGEIQLTAKLLQQTGTTVELELSVRDTGIGISAEELAGLFRPFSQADSSMSRRFGGSGLGLAISRNLITLMGGTIRVQSTPDRGSEFIVVVPFQAAPAALLDSLMPERPLPQRFSNVRALVVEDNEINREILVELLAQAGIETDTAVNGQEAVDMTFARVYDILFMDIQMPVLDGIAATREIRKLGGKGLNYLPIIAMTADALPGDEEKSLEAGMNAHLTKPINAGELDAALRHWLAPEKCCPGPAEQDAALPLRPVVDRRLLPSVPHLDMESALGRLGGKQKLYLKLLQAFAEEYSETPAQLMRELRTGEREQALHRIHAIRGVAGNLGGKGLEAAARELEKVCRETGSGVPLALAKPLKAFIDSHTALLETIGLLLARQPGAAHTIPAGPAGDEDELRSVLERLRIALENEEPVPCREITGELLQRQWPAGHEALLEKLHALVQSYRLGEALVLLNKEFKVS